MTLQNFVINAMVDILERILQSHIFFIPQNFKTLGCQWYAVKRIESIFADKGNSGTRFGVRATTKGEARRGGTPKTKVSPHQTAQYAPQTAHSSAKYAKIFPLRQFQDVGAMNFFSFLFLETNRM